MTPYTVIFSFYDPVEGDITVLAESPEAAQAIVKQLFSNRKNLTIVQVHKYEDYLAIQKDELPLFNKKDLN